PSEQLRRELTAKIGLLSSTSFRVREQAVEDLVKAGEAARPFLHAAQKNADLEIVRRAEQCLTPLAARKDKPLAAAAAPLITQAPPPQTVPVLLAYLPFLPDSSLHEEIQAALNAAAKKNASAQATLLEAVKDDHPGKRGAAAEALISSRIAEALP